jgi:hypothetical protein
VRTYVRNRNRLGGLAAQVLEQVLDEDRALSHLALNLQRRIIRGGEVHNVLAGSRRGHGVCIWMVADVYVERGRQLRA